MVVSIGIIIRVRSKKFNAVLALALLSLSLDGKSLLPVQIVRGESVRREIKRQQDFLRPEPAAQQECKRVAFLHLMEVKKACPIQN